MKVTSAAVTIGAIIGALGVIGLLGGEGKMAQMMSIDITLDLVRIGLGAWLIYAGMKSVETSRAALEGFGVVYIAFFILGFFSPTLFGVVPSGLGWMDQIIHLAGGIVGMWLGGWSPAGTRVRHHT